MVKKIFFILIMLIMCVISFGDDVIYGENIEMRKDGYFYYKNKPEEKVTGEVISVLPTRITVNFYLKNGKEEGAVKMYYPNGMLFSRENYKNGVMNGDFESWYPSGKIRTKGKLKNGTGKIVGYYESGKVKSVETYSNGKVIKTEKK